ncbi:flagellar hook-basal body complex protein FliE [Vibrio sp. HA2012]|uniref:flagellar hook-basal body complex protein FliE n=1 Tax=Vibrio sp. HA2012 TaxID=1971595 RepID=UPI000C2C88E9|nr:flagellar hook-basal body complex protein FliE [Vibrio sp. HA2012]PJC86441.1 flagellar hook-basal body complex protein FliE [Vibrio sp. HA2012]
MKTNSVMQMSAAQQLMLEKMEIMGQQAQTPFVVAANPFDQSLSVNDSFSATAMNEPLSFSGAMRQVLDRVNASQTEASDLMAAVETGKSDDLVGAMIASQKASLSFSALMQVRNKVVSSFEDVMKMPV